MPHFAPLKARTECGHHYYGRVCRAQHNVHCENMECHLFDHLSEKVVKFSENEGKRQESCVQCIVSER